VSTAAFQQQMGWLKASGYAAISLALLVDHYLKGSPLPARPIVLTFDDGYEDNLYSAYPVLESLGLQATIFLVAGRVGQAAFWDSSYGTPAKLLSWDAVRAMAKGCITFGAHTVTHPHLCQLSPTQARQEIRGAKTILEDELGREVSFFSYPFSDFSPTLRDYVAEAGYRAACSSIWGYNDETSDIYALRRVIVGGGDSLEAFARGLQRLHEHRGRVMLRSLLKLPMALAHKGEPRKGSF
jgi:peptidoglycan/xylan/chitin deacetylase (PgdA/CDA1 family)